MEYNDGHLSRRLSHHLRARNMGSKNPDGKPQRPRNQIPSPAMPELRHANNAIIILRPNSPSTPGQARPPKPGPSQFLGEAESLLSCCYSCLFPPHPAISDCACCIESASASESFMKDQQELSCCPSSFLPLPAQPWVLVNKPKTANTTF